MIVILFSVDWGEVDNRLADYARGWIDDEEAVCAVAAAVDVWAELEAA